jgi:hypothetical protein
MRVSIFKWFGLGAALAILALAAENSGQVGVAQQVQCTVTVPPGQSIQQAIDSTTEGALICLDSGTFITENLIIRKSLTLSGAGSGRTWIIPPHSPPIPYGSKPTIILIEGKVTVTLQGFTVGRLGAYPCAGLTDFPLLPCNGIEVRGQAEALIRDLEVFNQIVGVVLADSARLEFSGTIHHNFAGPFGIGTGIKVLGESQAIIKESQISNNGWEGILVSGSTHLRVQGSVVVNNGNHCWVCNGILLVDKAQLELIDSLIQANAGWGLAAFLKQCGYVKDNFAGQVVFEGHNVIEGNNKSGKLSGMGNPGNHPFTNLPDGQVCLP